MKNKQFVITSFSTKIEEATKIIEAEIKKPQENDVVIKNMYVGVNALYDRELYRGAVPYIDVQFPFVFGVEAVGEVVDKGSAVSKFQLGDKVGTVKVGTAYQEYQTVHQTEVISFPDATADYLTLSPTGVSAHLAITEVAELQEEDTVVISAAAGGLGHILVQLAKMKKCHVVAICGGPEKADMLKQLSCCDRIIDYKAEKVDEVLTKEYPNQIDVAIDSVGRGMFDSFLNNLANKGRLVVVGLASELSDSAFELITAPRVYETMYWKGASVRCFMNHLYKEKHQESRQFLFKLYQDEKLKIKVDPTSFKGIESVISASQYLLAGKSRGKVIVEL